MIQIAFGILLFFVALVIHEVSHGLAAYSLGDPTAKNAGRLSLNPLRHLDPFWTVIFPAFLFFSTQGRFVIGMAKPVPVDFSRLRRPKRDMFWVAMAGPGANFILAFLLGFFWRGTQATWLLYAIYFNIGLGVFNLIPIPPMDGSRMLASLLPLRLARHYLRLEPFGFAIVLALYVTGILYYFMFPAMDLACYGLNVPIFTRFLMGQYL